MSTARNAVKVYLTPQEIHTIDAEAQLNELPRSEYIRDRLLHPVSEPPKLPSVAVYQRAVVAALKASNGAINRTTAEAIVATIITNFYGTP